MDLKTTMHKIHMMDRNNPLCYSRTGSTLALGKHAGNKPWS